VFEKSVVRKECGSKSGAGEEKEAEEGFMIKESWCLILAR
jgi:hypothetical protein